MKSLLAIDKAMQKHRLRNYQHKAKDKIGEDVIAIQHLPVIDTMHRISKKIGSSYDQYD